MIIDFDLNVNTYEDFFSGKCKLTKYICPKCGCIHLVKHASYQRNLVIFKDNSFCDEKINIIRLICPSCNSTHAVLPNDIVPYCIYSFSLILHILCEYYVSDNSVLWIASKFNISFQLMYSFITRFLTFFYECIQCLKILEILLPENITTSLVAKNIYDYMHKGNNFLKSFLTNFRWCFLMIKFHNMKSPPVYVGMANKVT